MKGLLAAAAVCVLLVAAPAFAQTAGAEGVARSWTLSQQDQTFVKEAGAGSLMQKGGTPAIREFGRWMYTDHGIVANNWLKEIMAAQHQPFEPTLTAEQRQMQQKLEGLSGREFEREYIQYQVTDHEKTIPIFEKEARDGQNPMIKNFAENLVPVLRQHLDEAKILAGNTAMAG